MVWVLIWLALRFEPVVVILLSEIIEEEDDGKEILYDARRIAIAQRARRCPCR